MEFEKITHEQVLNDLENKELLEAYILQQKARDELLADVIDMSQESLLNKLQIMLEVMEALNNKRLKAEYDLKRYKELYRW